MLSATGPWLHIAPVPRHQAIPGRIDVGSYLMIMSSIRNDSLSVPPAHSGLTDLLRCRDDGVTQCDAKRDAPLMSRGRSSQSNSGMPALQVMRQPTETRRWLQLRRLVAAARQLLRREQSRTSACRPVGQPHYVLECVGR